eukprot:scaffold10769_cov297-Chaetoceros_neogracile.AAC.1
MANVKEYKAFRGVHGRAPYIHENSGLFHWCSEVRIGYCKKREQGLEGIASNGVEITVDREALLRSVGFDLVLPVSTDKKPTRGFADRIESIKRYMEMHGHLNPRPSDGDESKSLYNFIIEVRISYRKRLHEHQPKNERFKLTDDKYDALNAVGFPFEVVYLISPTEPEGKPTSSPAAKPKVKPSVPTKAKDKPTEDAETSSRKMDNTVFIQNVEAYKAFINEHGIEPSNSTNTKLYTWHNKLCRAYKMRRDNVSGKSPIVLTDERLSILKAAGINIIPLQTLDRISASADALFMANLEEYKAFKEVHGRAPYIHENSGLFHWCSDVRIGYCKKREQGLEAFASNGVEITVGREALLRSIGFDLVLPVSTDKKPTHHFADRIESIKRYKEKHGHLNPRKSDGDESKSLFSFISEVQMSYRQRLHEHQPKNERFRLTDYRYDALNAVGFPFEIVYPISLIEPKGEPTPGQAVKPIGKPSLSTKAKRRPTRSQAAKPKLKPSVPTKAKSIPTPYQAATSKHAMIEESTSPSNRRSRIKRKPVTYEEDFDDSLIGEVSGLDIISASADSLFMENFEKYKAFREVHGRAPYIHENLDLFHWCSEVRIGYKKRGQDLVEVIASNGVEITVGREALLRSIGFDLVLPYSADRKLTNHFADRIKALKQYKEKHGHLNPPSSIGNGSRLLYSFIHEVRMSYHNRLDQINHKRFKLTDGKYDALNAVGFPFEIVYPISPIEPEGKPSPSQAAKPKLKPSVATKAKRRPTRSQAAKPKLKPSVPTKHKHIPTPSQPATSKHTMIAESTSPSNRHSRIKRKP